jgi:hypothetical protein
MGNSTATEVAWTASVSLRVATTDLEVFERAITQGDSRGQVCPKSGGAAFGAFLPQAGILSARGRSGRYGSTPMTSAVVGLGNVKSSKPRTGYHATSGTG